MITTKITELINKNPITYLLILYVIGLISLIVLKCLD